MRVKGLVALLTAVLSISLLPQVAHAADSPSFEIKSVSATAIDPGDTVTWKIQVNLIPGWVKYLNLNLIDPSGQVRQISSDIEKTYEVKEKKSVEISLSLKTNEYDLAGKYRLQWGYLANVTEVAYYDPINGKEYAGKIGKNTFAQNLSKFDFTIRDAGTGKQKSPQLVESIGFNSSQINPGSSAKFDLVTFGTGILINAYVTFSSPDGQLSAYCDAINMGISSSCLGLTNTNGRYSFSIPVWTSEDNSPGLYKVTQINLNYRSGNPDGIGNNTASWGGNVYYTDTETFYNGVKTQSLNKFPQSSLSFTLLDAGQGVAQTPIWSELSWKTKSVQAGSIATLLVSANGFDRFIGNISVPVLSSTNGKNEYVYTNQSNTQVIRQIKPTASTSILPATKSGSYEVDIYVPRSTKPGSYSIGQMTLLSTSCEFTLENAINSVNAVNGLNCQGWPNGWHTSFNMGNLSKDFGSSGISAKTWNGYVNPLSVQLEVTSAAPLEAPKISEVYITPSSIEYSFPYTSDQNCVPSSNSGDLADESIQKGSTWYFKVSNLNPDSEITVKLTCTDATGAKAESIANTRTAKPIAPASPKLTLDSTTTSTATFSIGIREGFKYSVMADSGQAIIQGSKVEVIGLKPGVKTFIVATITDSFGQSTSAEPFYFAAALPEKPAKPTLAPGKVTTNRVEFKYEKLSNLDYELTVSEGEVVDIRGSVSVSRLAPDTKITASLKVIDEFGQSSTSDTLVLKSAIPELPAMPVLYLAKATSESITLRFTPRAGLNYAIKATAGTGSISNGSIVITGLKPTQKVAVSLVMTDIYGQYKSSDFYTFATTAAAKAAAKTSITCVKGKTSKVITAVKPTCPTGYIKK